MTFVRFSAAARSVLQKAYQEATARGSKEIEVEHLRSALEQAANGEDAQATEGTGS